MVMGKGRTSSFIAIAMMVWYGGYLCDTFLSEEKKDIAKSLLKTPFQIGNPSLEKQCEG